MKNISSYLTIFASLFVVAIIVKSALAQSLPTISPFDAQKLSGENKAVIVDVREVEEIMAGKIKGGQKLLWP